MSRNRGNLTKRIAAQDEHIAELEKSLLELAVRVAELTILLEKHCLDELVETIKSPPEPGPVPAEETGKTEEAKP
jgi:hypothetical protein